MKFSFKDKYNNSDGTDLERTYPCLFYHNMPTGTEGTREYPRSSKPIIPIVNSPLVRIFAGGYHKITFSQGSTSSATNYFIGHGIGVTVFDIYISISVPAAQSSYYYYENASFYGSTLSFSGPGNGYLNNNFRNCEFIRMPNLTRSGGTGFNLRNCLFRDATYINNAGVVSNMYNSFVGLPASFTLRADDSAHLFENCDIELNATNINKAQNNYLAFDRCRFKIGLESDFTELAGGTQAELRASFVSRCTAQGITLQSITEFDYAGVKQGRWIFTKQSAFDGIVYMGSEIYNFETIRSIKLGYFRKRADCLKITSKENEPSAFVPSQSDLVLSENAATLPATLDITNEHRLKMGSNIIWMGGKKRLTYMNILNNISPVYGVSLDSLINLHNDASQKILAGESKIKDSKFYVVRSTNKQFAEIMYNGVKYSTSLITRDNLLAGVAGSPSFSVLSGNPAIYEIADELQYKTVKMRIVNKIPEVQITTGNLQQDYWYLVEHNSDQGNLTDYITYNGTNYPVGSSFLVLPGKLTFSTSGNIHLRRCWHDAFDYATEVTDKEFWKNEQKPIWFNVIADDLRCLLKDNNSKAPEMATDPEGGYITSGHPDFYRMISGSEGSYLKAHSINGTYMQLCVDVSTLNLM